ncbi:Uncharacterised protein [Mycobacteroides abscessus subsp. abscessus]|nr:Uncharacterised protein [Mycobacteroides abscessus subsp. abscessus]
MWKTIALIPVTGLVVQEWTYGQPPLEAVTTSAWALALQEDDRGQQRTAYAAACGKFGAVEFKVPGPEGNTLIRVGEATYLAATEEAEVTGWATSVRDGIAATRANEEREMEKFWATARGQVRAKLFD